MSSVSQRIGILVSEVRAGRYRKSWVPIIVLLWLAPFATQARAACEDGKALLTVVNDAADLTKRGRASLAITLCYERYLNSSTFHEGDFQIQERFLYEYSQACFPAAEQRGADRPALYKEAAKIALEYITWYRSLTPDAVNGPGRERVSAIVYSLGEAYLGLCEYDKLLEDYQEVSEIPSQGLGFFNLHSVEDWEKALRRYPDLNRSRGTSEVRIEILKDPSYKEKWIAFYNFLKKLSGVPERRWIADQKLPQVESLLR